MRKTNDIKDNFSALLRDSLRSRFGRIPSAAVVAREFNLRAYDTAPISQESARRWIRGVSLPEEERLRVLVNWLDLDFNKVLRARERTYGVGFQVGNSHNADVLVHGSHHGNGVSALGLTGTGNGNSGNGHSGNGHTGNGHLGNGHTGNGHSGNGLSRHELEVLQLLSGLTDEQKRVVVDLIRKGFSPHPVGGSGS